MTKTIDDNNYITEQDVYVPLNAQEQAPLYSPDCNKNEESARTSGAHQHATRTTVTTTHIPSPIPKPNLAQMKRDRVKAQTLGGWVGGALGFVLLFIPGAIIGAIAGNKITKHALKQEERQAQQDYEYRLSQLSAMRESTSIQQQSDTKPAYT